MFAAFLLTGKFLFLSKRMFGRLGSTLQSQYGVQRLALLPARRFWISDLPAVFVEFSCSSCFTVAVSGDVLNGL